MTEQEVLSILQATGAILTEGHFVYTSGRHGSTYINKDAIYPHTRETSLLCRAIAEHFQKYRAQAVVAPAVGGVILSQWIAFHLTELSGHEVLGVYAEKSPDGSGSLFRRQYDRLVTGKKVLIVEDILTTGGSVKKVVDLVREVGGKVVGVGCLVNRGNVSAEEIGEVPQLFSLANLKFESWEPADCPLCAQKVPFNTEVGKVPKT